MSCQYHYLDCGQDSGGDSYVHQWKALFDRVEQWYEQRPSQMKAVFGVSMPGPFPTVIYGNGAASAFTVNSSWWCDANEQSPVINYTTPVHYSFFSASRRLFLCRESQ